MRPLYETDSHLKKERLIAEDFCKIFGVDIVKLPISYHVDYAIVRDGKITAFLEIKCRNINFGTYPDIILSVNKYLYGRKLFETFGTPFIFAIGLNDGLYWTTLSEGTYSIGIGGRVDRGDWQDIEPVIHIPMSAFKKG